MASVEDALASKPSSNGSFSGPAIEVDFKGLLFDMDGTIIDSTVAVVKHWTNIADELGIDPQVILATSHGRRSIDVLKILAPELANWEYVQKVEGILPQQYGDSAKPIPGAHTLITSLTPDPTSPTSPSIQNKKNPISAPPLSSPCPWAIVTSGSRPLVTGWIKLMALPPPLALITAEDVEHGKPNPACYLLGLEKLGLLTHPSSSSSSSSPQPPTPHQQLNETTLLAEAGATGHAFEHKNEHVLVIEDAPAGIKAGKAAGCKVLGLVTSHTVEQVLEAGPDWIVRDLRSVRVVSLGGEGVGKGVRLEIGGLWVPGEGVGR